MTENFTAQAPMPHWFEETKMAAVWFGMEVIDSRTSGDHEGWGCHLLQHSTGWAALTWQYGNCNRCDPYAGLFLDEITPDGCFEVFEDCIQLFEDEFQAREYFKSDVENAVYQNGYCRRYLLEISFTHLTFPILRRVFPSLIANEIVSVQPMTAPAGSVFFMDYKYERAATIAETASVIKTLPPRSGVAPALRNDFHVYEVAKLLNRPNREVLARIRELGIQLPHVVTPASDRDATRRRSRSGHHMSKISAEDTRRLMESFGVVQEPLDNALGRR